MCNVQICNQLLAVKQQRCGKRKIAYVSKSRYIYLITVKFVLPVVNRFAAAVRFDDGFVLVF